MKRGRILLADDHALILEGFRTILGPHYDIVGAVTDGLSLIEAALKSKPDLIILDVTMPLLNGIKAAGQIRKKLPGMKFLFVTMHSSPAYLQAAFNVGATGFVLKSSSREELLDAVEKVMKGRVYTTPGVGGESLEQFRDPIGKHAVNAKFLTAREWEILQLVAQGHSNKETGYLLQISAKTVAFHRENIKNKLGLRSTAELTQYAIQEGLI
jgi:DNA-binding NarL/FixJ family response regulator